MFIIDFLPECVVSQEIKNKPNIITGNKVFIIMGLSYYKPTSINVFRIKKVVYNVKAKKRICSAAKIWILASVELILLRRKLDYRAR